MDYKKAFEDFNNRLKELDAASVEAWERYDEERLLQDSLRSGHLTQSLTVKPLPILNITVDSSLMTGLAGGETNYAMAA